MLVLPDGTKQTILDVPRYDFNWQTYYMFAKPIAIPAGAKIVSTAWYDNSAKNPANPDPKVDVHLGRSDVGRNAVHGAHLQYGDAVGDRDYDGGGQEIDLGFQVPGSAFEVPGFPGSGSQ